MASIQFGKRLDRLMVMADDELVELPIRENIAGPLH